jgi:uncharacterized protein DUF2785
MNKQSIQALVDNDYKIPEGGNLEEMTTQLEHHLSSLDADVRENSLEVLWQWGMTGLYTDGQLIDLGERMAANLKVGLGKSGTDTVFLRAFSVLGLAMVLIVDQRYEQGQCEGRAPFLSQVKLLEWYEQTLAVLDGENDYRGFVTNAGWAHSVAHISDALRDFARSRHLDTPQLERMLGTIASKLAQPSDAVYSFDEDNRLVQAVISVLRRNQIPLSSLNHWLESLSVQPDGSHWADVVSMEGCDEQINNARLNVRSFLRSLYFQLLIGSRSHLAKVFPDYYALPIPHREALIAGIVETLRKMDKYFYAREE